jgi:hypothetical protein
MTLVERKIRGISSDVLSLSTDSETNNRLTGEKKNNDNRDLLQYGAFRSENTLAS